MIVVSFIRRPLIVYPEHSRRTRETPFERKNGLLKEGILWKKGNRSGLSTGGVYLVHSGGGYKNGVDKKELLMQNVDTLSGNPV